MHSLLSHNLAVPELSKPHSLAYGASAVSKSQDDPV